MSRRKKEKEIIHEKTNAEKLAEYVLSHVSEVPEKRWREIRSIMAILKTELARLIKEGLDWKKV